VSRFHLLDSPIEPQRLRLALQQGGLGAYVAFEGWVRDHNEGRTVQRLEYEAFAALAQREGERIIDEASGRFALARAQCAHRVGALAVGELAVWVGVSSVHRDAAFQACRYIIDEIKHRLPIWKKEYYVEGDSGWINCEACAAHAHRSGESAHQHG
jgi:molybdopterin synthase catalytic subunit